MDSSVVALWEMPEPQLLAAYYTARRSYAEKRFARDTERGRLQWLRAKAFVNAKGGVTERMNAVDASEDLAKKGQHVREISLELDLLKSDIDVIATMLRLRGVTSAGQARDGDNAHTANETGTQPEDI